MMCVKGAAKRPRKKIEISKRAVDGSITLYLALTLAVTLSLYTVLILGARIGAARMQTESVCRIAQNASLAEFHRELHSRYDLFMTDTSYGGAGGGNEVFAQHLRGYMEKNCERRAAGLFGVSRDWTSLKIIDAQVTDARYACDNNGRAVREQVYAYMAADPAGSVIADILVSADRWKGLEISGREWTTRTDENSEELKQALRNGREEQREENERKEENEEEVSETEREAASDEPSEAEDMVDHLESFRFLPILTQVFGDLQTLSDEQIDTGNHLCARDVHLGSGMMAENSHGYPMADEILFDRYIYEKTGNCAKPLDDGKLRYQTEYILCGKGSDKENLEGTAARLLLIREAANCAYLFTDQQRMREAELLAAVVSLVLLNPELREVLKTALLFAWAYLESIRDLRTLFDGGRVPLLKNSDTWQTSLLGILTPETSVRGGGASSGLLYTDYLQALLYLEGSSVKSLRTMDIMEMDIRQTEWNGSFRMDWCLDAFSMKADVKSRLGYEFVLIKSEGYN